MTVAKALTNEFFLRYGFSRKVLSDNGSQFISSLMQSLSIVLGFKQIVTPVYHPQANPVERKNRDLKNMIAMEVFGNHRNWPNRVSAARFAMNSAVCQATGYTPGYLMFGTDLRTAPHVIHDLRPILDSANIVPELIPEITAMNESMRSVYEHQASGGEVKLPDPKTLPTFKVGDLVFVKSHTLSNAAKGTTAKFDPVRDGPYTISEQTGANTYRLMDESENQIGLYSAQDLTRYVPRVHTDPIPEPTIPKRNRGRPKGSKSKKSKK